MNVKRLFQRKKKKSSEHVKILKKSNSADENTIPSNGTDSSSFSSEEGGNNSNNIPGHKQQKRSSNGVIALRQYSDNVDGSAIATFARMSTTIAQTLSEQEFGSQKNTLYRPNTTDPNSEATRIVHPVLCKRDIFVKSVTPTKPDRRSKKISIYQVDDKESYLVKEATGDDNIIKRKTGHGKHIKLRSQSDGDIVFKQEQQQQEQEQKQQEQQQQTTNDGVKTADDSATNNSNIPSYSISASMLFRERKQLSVETGSRMMIASDDAQILPTNKHRLHFVQNSDYQQYLKSRAESSLLYSKQFRGSYYSGMPVSPSSTVSSLTIPAELDFDPTPKALFHQLMKSPPHLESVKEQSTSCSGERETSGSDVEGEIAQEPQTYTIDEEEGVLREI